jgi:hypothetical protein
VFILGSPALGHLLYAEAKRIVAPEAFYQNRVWPGVVVERWAKLIQPVVIGGGGTPEIDNWHFVGAPHPCGPPGCDRRKQG